MDRVARPIIWWRLAIGFACLAVLPAILTAHFLSLQGDVWEIRDFFLVELLVSTVSTLVLGPPILWLFRRYGWESWVAFALAGAVVGPVAPAIAALLTGHGEHALLAITMTLPFTLTACPVSAIVFRHILYGGLAPQPMSSA